MKLSEKVQALLQSNITAYRIEKETGVAQPNITRLRNGQSDVGHMSVDNAEKLAKFWDATMIDLAIKGKEDDDLREFPQKLTSLFAELVQDQIEIAKSDEATPDDRPMGYVLQQLHNDVINDPVEMGRLIEVYDSHRK